MLAKGLSTEQAKKEIDKIEGNPMNTEYIKFLAKELVNLKEKAALKTQAISQIDTLFGNYYRKIDILLQRLDRIGAQLKVLHDQLVGLVAKQH
ncbi:hypothetical protein HpBT060_15100 [Helicobacter pylori]